MFHEMTPAVARAVNIAMRQAIAAGAAAVACEHLMMGLLDEQEGRAAQLLAGVGLSVPSFWNSQSIASANDSANCDVLVPLTPVAERALEAARDLAKEMTGEAIIASEHLIVALVREDEPLRTRLTQHGLDIEQLEMQFQALQSPALQIDEPLELSATAEEMNTARILDANLNRAREALRVLEDYCRFALEDGILTEELKRLRHDLRAAFNELPSARLLEARDTLGDVGTEIGTPSEGWRESLLGVLQANNKRLQEALRSLEEYAKIQSPEIGERMEQCRYQAYTLERAIFLGASSRERLAHARLYLLVTGSLCGAAVDWTVQEALAGGVQIVQLREKTLSDRALLERARLIRRLTRVAGALFIINDRPEIARLVEADGVHLGQQDMPVKEARRILGSGKLIGVSTHELSQVRRAVLDGASYIGVGPTFPSGTKSFDHFPGLDFARQASSATSLPMFAIGGVNETNLESLLAVRIKQVAVSAAICRADDPRAVAAELRRVLDRV